LYVHIAAMTGRVISVCSSHWQRSQVSSQLIDPSRAWVTLMMYSEC